MNAATVNWAVVRLLMQQQCVHVYLLDESCGMTTFLSELYAFYLEHRRCGELEGAVAEATVWLRCSCSAQLIRRIPPEPAETC